MKKTTRTIIILLAALVLLAGAFLAVKLLNKEPEEEVPAEESYTVLFSADPATITEIAYTYQGEEIALLRKDGGWALKDAPDFPIDPALIDAMATELAEIKLYKEIQTEENLGFADDGIDITVKAAENCHFVLGMINNQIDKGYLLTDTSVIYTVPSTLRKAFQYTRDALLLADAMPEIYAVAVRTMEVSSGENAYTIRKNAEQVSYYSYEYTLENALGSTPLDPEKTENFLFAATAPRLECVDPSPDAATVGEAGFVEDGDLATVKFTYISTTEEGEELTHTYTYFIGKSFTETENGEETVYHYVMLEDSPMLFRITDNYGGRILSPALSDLAPAELCRMEFSQIREFAFTVKGESHKSAREKTEDETVCYLDGKEINYGYVESFFLDLVQMPTEGSYTDALPASEPVITAEFLLNINDTEESYSLAIYEYNSNFCIAVFSGRQDVALVSTRDVNTLYDCLAELNENAAR